MFALCRSFYFVNHKEAHDAFDFTIGLRRTDTIHHPDRTIQPLLRRD